MPFWKTDLTGRALVLPRAAWDDQHASALECALPMDEGTTDRHGDVPNAPNTEITVAAVPAPTLATGQTARFYGSCCSFAGGAGLTVTFDRSLFGASSPDFTMESWVRVAETGDGTLFSIGTDQITVAIAGPNIVLCGDTSSTFARAVWAHFAVVRNGSTTVTLFVNGVPKCTSSPAIVATTTCKAFRVACLASDMRVYSKAKYTANFASSFVPTVVPASDITRVANSTTVSIGVTPSTYRTMRVYAGFADPGQGPSAEVAFSARAAEYVAPVTFSYAAVAAYSTEPSTLAVSTTGYSSAAPGFVTIFASKTSGDASPTMVSARTALSSTGTAAVEATFPTTGQWYVYARFSNAEGVLSGTAYTAVTSPASQSVAAARYTMPTGFTFSPSIVRTAPAVASIYAIDATGAKTGAYTTDPHAASLTLAFPGDSTSDVSSQISPSSTTKTLALKTGYVTTSNSKFYGSSYSILTGGAFVVSGLPSDMFNGNFTLEAWLRPAIRALTPGGYLPNNLPYNVLSIGASARQMRVWFETPGERWGGYYLDNGTRLGRFCVYKGGDVPVTYYTPDTYYTPFAYVAETWHHLALVSNGTSFVLYLNGAAALTFPASPLPVVTQFCMGGLVGSEPHDFYGQIQDMRLYTTAKYTGVGHPILTIAATGASADHVSIDVYYGATASPEGLTKCGVGALVSGSSSVPVSIPTGTWYLYPRVISPYGATGAPVASTHVITSRPYIHATSIASYTPTTFVASSTTMTFAVTLSGYDSGVPGTAAVYYAPTNNDASPTKIGESAIVGGVVTVTGNIPSSAFFLYARTISPETDQGPLAVSAQPVTSRAYTLPTSVSIPAKTVYLTAVSPINMTFAPADGSCTALVTVYYHTTSTSSTPTQCGSGVVSASGSADVTFAIPATGTYYLYAKVTAPNGTAGSLLAQAAPVTAVTVTMPPDIFWPAGDTGNSLPSYSYGTYGDTIPSICNLLWDVEKAPLSSLTTNLVTLNATELGYRPWSQKLANYWAKYMDLTMYTWSDGQEVTLDSFAKYPGMVFKPQFGPITYPVLIENILTGHPHQKYYQFDLSVDFKWGYSIPTKASRIALCMENQVPTGYIYNWYAAQGATWQLWGFPDKSYTAGQGTLIGTFGVTHFSSTPNVFKWTALSWPAGKVFSHYLWKPSVYNIVVPGDRGSNYSSCPPILGN